MRSSIPWLAYDPDRAILGLVLAPTARWAQLVARQRFPETVRVQSVASAAVEFEEGEAARRNIRLGLRDSE